MPERVAGHVRVGALLHQVVEQTGDEILHPERQSKGVELGLRIRAVHGGDAGRDVALLVDVLDGDGRTRAENDGLKLLERAERSVKQALSGYGAGLLLPGRE